MDQTPPKWVTFKTGL